MDATHNTLATKLNKLFLTTVDEQGKPKSIDAVAREISSRGVSISGVYLHALRSGTKDNPTKRHLQALADYFEVDPAYFFECEEHEDHTEEQIGLTLAMRDAKVRAFAMRAAGLSEEAFTSLLSVIDYSRSREGLPEISGDDESPSRRSRTDQ